MNSMVHAKEIMQDEMTTIGRESESMNSIKELNSIERENENIKVHHKKQYSETSLSGVWNL